MHMDREGIGATILLALCPGGQIQGGGPRHGDGDMVMEGRDIVMEGRDIVIEGRDMVMEGI